MSRVGLMIITDGRDEYLKRSIDSVENMVPYGFTDRVIFDDSGDDMYRLSLQERYGVWYTIKGLGEPRLGFTGNVRRMWDYVSQSGLDYVFHLEGDFTFNVGIDIDMMLVALNAGSIGDRYLIQMALRRQPWNQEEINAGGIVEQHPEDYEDVSYAGLKWLEHRRFFTTNPSLYRAELCRSVDWPDRKNSEGHFSINTLAYYGPGSRFAFWGRRQDTPMVHHIGNERKGIGY